MTSLVELTGAGVSLGGRRILRDVDFSLVSGQVAAVTGPNGSGKTTLVRMVASLTRIDQGSGKLMGVDLRSNDVYGVRRAIAMIGHLPALVPELTLSENLEHVARLTGADPDRIARILEVVGLAEAASIRAADSSFGTQRRAEVGRALLTEPRLLLLDEAYSGLDEAAKGLVDALIDRTLSSGGGVVMVSHELSHLSSRASQIYRLMSGTLEAAA